jgi:hypothetical protein
MGNLIYTDKETLFNRIIFKLQANEWDFMTSPELNVMKFKSNLTDRFMVYKYYEYKSIETELHIIIVLNELGEPIRENSFYNLKEMFRHFDNCMYLM